MTTQPTVRELNETLAKEINREALSNPNSPYAGKFVGLANGRVVVVANDPDELGRRLAEAEPDPEKAFWIEASYDYENEVEELWSLS